MEKKNQAKQTEKGTTEELQNGAQCPHTAAATHSSSCGFAVSCLHSGHSARGLCDLHNLGRIPSHSACLHHTHTNNKHIKTPLVTMNVINHEQISLLRGGSISVSLRVAAVSTRVTCTLSTSLDSDFQRRGIATEQLDKEAPADTLGVHKPAAKPPAVLGAHWMPSARHALCRCHKLY